MQQLDRSKNRNLMPSPRRRLPLCHHTTGPCQHHFRPLLHRPGHLLLNSHLLGQTLSQKSRCQTLRNGCPASRWVRQENLAQASGVQRPLHSPNLHPVHVCYLHRGTKTKRLCSRRLQGRLISDISPEKTRSGFQSHRLKHCRMHNYCQDPEAAVAT
jgi:hypothetical protein